MRSGVGVDIFGIFPSVVLLSEALPLDLELESIVEPLGVQILLYDPEILIIDLDRRRSRIRAVQDRVGSSLRQDIDMENVVDLPLSGKFKLVCQIQELILDSEWAVSFTSEFQGGLVSCEVSSLEPNQISDLETGIVAFPFIIGSFRNLL